MSKVLGGLHLRNNEKNWQRCAGCGKKMHHEDAKVMPRISVNPDRYFYHLECVPEEIDTKTKS